MDSDELSPGCFSKGTFSQTNVTRVMLFGEQMFRPGVPTKATGGLAFELHQERGEHFAECSNARLLLRVCK